MSRAKMERHVASAMNSQSTPDDFYERIEKRLRKRIADELRTARCTLDLGCGNCDLDQYLASKYRQEVTGVDISDGSFPQREKTPEAGRILLRCIKANASHLGFVRDAEMDAVISVWALHEIKDRQGALHEACRVLRPKGKILIVDFPKGSLAQRLWDEDYLTPCEVRRLLKDAGFVGVRVRTVHSQQVIWAVGFRPPNAGT